MIILSCALLLRLGWSLHLPADDASLAALPDQQEYIQLGRNLLNGRGLVLHDARFDADLYAYRTPGYPAFIAACGGSIRIARVMQALLDTSTVLAVYFLGRRSLIAAAIVAVNPLLIYFSGLMLSETLFTAMLVWGMTLLRCEEGALRATGSTKLATGRYAGMIVLALSVLVRPEMLLLPLALVALNRPGDAAYGILRMALILIVVLFPWALRNRIRLHAWVWTTSNGGITLYDGFNPMADGSSDQSFIRQMPQLQLMGELERSSALGGQAVGFIESHPAQVIHLTVNKIARTWSPMPLSKEYGGDPKKVLIGLLYTLPLFALAIAGLVRAPLPMPARVFLLLPAIYITVVHAASVGSLRYRVPADVPMAVLAAGGLHRRLLNEERRSA